MLSVFIDGASRGNPGPSSIGIIIRKRKVQISRFNEFLGIMTNNQAEYHALKRALQITQYMSRNVVIMSDSNLLINQRQNKYKVRNAELKIISREISNLESLFDSVEYKHIPREENNLADMEANLAIDHYLKYE
ncbi:MAG TPA: ribonuclease HI family protein [Nitrososphaeraceae archaeon]|jgi:ribonuclease HI